VDEPATFFKRRYLLSGAQGVESYARILERSARMQD